MATLKHYRQVISEGVDAEFASSLAQQYIDKGYLSPKQIVYTRKLMPKYAGQLSRIAKQLHG